MMHHPKMKTKILLTYLSFFWVASSAFAQVVTTIPSAAAIDDSIVVIFNAGEGDRGLVGFNGEIYAHTGLITELSQNSHDWRFVIGTWGDNIRQPQLTNIGGDLWQLTIGKVRDFYGVPKGEKVLQLAFVFRSADTQTTGRDVGGADIFIDIFDETPSVVLLSPTVDNRFGDPRRSPVFSGLGDTVAIVATSTTSGMGITTLQLFNGNTELVQVTQDTLVYDFVAADFGVGMHNFSVVANDSAGAVDSVQIAIMVNSDVPEIARPPDVIDGVNVINNTSVTLSLFAPFKQFVYVIGDFNDWKVDPDYFMNRDSVREDSVHYWLTMSGLDPDVQYTFQYLVDGNLRIADPFSELILTPSDQRIQQSTFPNLKAYPDRLTSDDASTLKINEVSYQWQVPDFQRPAKEDLVIYELLVRDFIAAHDYSTLVDTLQYLARLGVNAVELMPVTEFEGNESWGYNPAFYFAPDKYYGPPNQLRRFIDECHKRGIAIILDTVLNHSFGQHSLVRLYASGNFGPPTAENPWYNVVARHPFNVGWDFNHESLNTKSFVDRVNAYWLTEFKVDGFRFDLSKGFTQRNSGNNVGLWSQFDASRIAILSRMANRIWDVDSTAYVILEHFAENSEETVLSDRGMMLWGNMNTAYSQSAMGFLNDPVRNSDLAGGYYKNRGWTQPNLVTYMESHDEPWLMYKNLQFGRGSSDGRYRIQELATALDRIKLVATFFLTIPGPKMLWQFGELGYDQNLPESGFARTAPKPILWQYFNNGDRRRLYDFMSALLRLRQEHAVFRSPDTQVFMRVGQGQFDRVIRLSHPLLNVTIIGNFDVNRRSATPNFQHTGVWYDYFFSDSLTVSNPNASISLKAGEFHLYTDKNIGFPDQILVTSVNQNPKVRPAKFELFQNYPNPFNPTTTISFEVGERTRVVITIYDILGQRVRTLLDEEKPTGTYAAQWNGKNDFGTDTASGLYIVRMKAGDFSRSLKLLKLK